MESRLTDFEWSSIYAAIRYYCGKYSMASAMYPDELVEAVYSKLSEYQKGQLALTIKTIMEENKETMRDLDTMKWTKLYKLLDGNEHIIIETTSGEIEVFKLGDDYYPILAYITAPHIDTTINPPFTIKEKYVLDRKTGE